MFIEEGLERGVDAITFSQDLGGPGVSSVDFDGDGDDDLTLGSNGDVLFYENHEGQFQLIDLSIETPPGEVRGVVWTDINNDGNLDLLISAYQGEIRLYKNLGGLEFEDITESCGIFSDPADNWGISFSDFNRDGFVDLQLCRYGSWLPIPDNPSEEPEKWTRLYFNNGDETFTDFTIAGGFAIDPAPVFLGAFFDFNNDLWPDNHTIIDRGPGNRLFINNQGTFTDVTEDFGVSFPNNDVMSNSISDYNNDGYLDIFMTNNNALNTSTILLENNEGESFTNATSSAGVDILEWGWGAIWIDGNNDGWQDLYFGTRTDDPNFLFLNEQGVFTDQSVEMQLEDEVPSYSAAKGDYDNDGCYDMLIQSTAPNRSILLMNQGNNNNYIKLTPHGTISNSMAIGSWVKVYANGNQYVHFTLCGEGYISQNSQHLIFGLGQETAAVDSVTIWYPSGHMDSYYNLPSDSAYHFYEGETFQVEIMPADSVVCVGEEVQLDAGVHPNYLWSTGDTSRFITVETAGVYSVSVTNEFGITATQEMDVTFQPLPIITETISPNACRGDSSASVSLENLLNTAADSVIWNNGMTGETIDSLSSGEYAYTFTDVNGCETSGTVTVIDPMELLVYANTNPSDVDQFNGSIDLTVFGGVSPYVVVFEGDTVGFNIEGLSAGEYTIAVTDAYGCTVMVEIILDSTLGITGKKLSESISIYPNLIWPGSELSLRLERDVVNLILRIRDLNGRVLQENIFRDLASGHHAITVSNLSSGIYLYELVLKEKIYSGKLIIQ